MGRGKGKNKRNSSYKSNKKQRKPDEWQSGKDQSWNDFLSVKNPEWEEYYKAQGVCPEEEFEAMETALRTPLPAAIRVNPQAGGAAAIIKRCQSLVESAKGTPAEPRQLKWYPGDNGWQWDQLDRRQIKKLPGLKKLKQWLMDNELRGALSRQETVSMIPALCLSVQPSDSVLDLCAAPGSKTCQIIELMTSESGNGLPSGLVLANELDWKRANMLAHQVQRLGSASAGCVNIDANYFPALQRADGSPFKFDRILCDVPCTSDATLRKTPQIWQSWKAKDGYAIHAIQLQILLKGLDLLTPGGTLVYSTCSLNPMEDEAVVCAGLKKFNAMSKEKVEVVALPAHLQEAGLQGRPGLTSWQLIQAPEKIKAQPSWAPPGEEEEGIKAQLQLTRRFLPHDMNTGGFYVAVFKKLQDSKEVKEPKMEAKKETKESGEEAPKLSPVSEDFADVEPEDLEKLRKFYGISEESLPQGRLIKATKEGKKLFLISEKAREFLSCRVKSKARVLHLGTKVFTNAEFAQFADLCPYRISQEGVAALRPSLPRRVILLSPEKMKKLLEEREMDTDDLEGSEREGVAKGEELVPGGCIAECNGILVACMLSFAKLKVYCEKKETAALLGVLEEQMGEMEEWKIDDFTPKERTGPKSDDGAGGDGEEQTSQEEE